MAEKRAGIILRLPTERHAGKKPRQLDEMSRQMLEAEQALFVALRLAQTHPTPKPAQAATQPPPRTSSSRKKTAA